MAERLNAPVLKTGVPRGIGGSNPSLSAKKKALINFKAFFLCLVFFVKFAQLQKLTKK
jgi:hypothetical protein